MKHIQIRRLTWKKCKGNHTLVALAPGGGGEVRFAQITQVIRRFYLTTLVTGTQGGKHKTKLKAKEAAELLWMYFINDSLRLEGDKFDSSPQLQLEEKEEEEVQE